MQLTLFTLAGAAALTSLACSRHASSNPPPAESVDVGYGSQPKDKVTGAVTTLSEDDIVKKPLRIEDLLRGKVSGLEVVHNGNNVSFRIRGMSSLSYGANGAGPDQEPLVVVDGVMIQQGNIANALAGLTPEDIKQINVLKDVASTSIYGLRGANGVILITTKAKLAPAVDTI